MRLLKYESRCNKAFFPPKAMPQNLSPHGAGVQSPSISGFAPSQEPCPEGKAVDSIDHDHKFGLLDQETRCILVQPICKA